MLIRRKRIATNSTTLVAVMIKAALISHNSKMTTSDEGATQMIKKVVG